MVEVVVITLFKFTTMFCGIDSIPRNILGYVPYSYQMWERYWEYSVKYCQSNKTLLWIWIMLWLWVGPSNERKLQWLLPLLCQKKIQEWEKGLNNNNNAKSKYFPTSWLNAMLWLLYIVYAWYSMSHILLVNNLNYISRGFKLSHRLIVKMMLFINITFWNENKFKLWHSA